ncbi:MFS transporter [Luteolibacter ambystomatis]|uniref:MFS transporter n=1 Tax=Luteolibacter ambystomatis TaxID=2824561 RepID=A0A975G7U3_9BACT|nr:MFS transporter [Luteolibacter ambystomatis]QUE50944.1 MFS transporter [Luteolibacter ambystomatis]
MLEDDIKQPTRREWASFWSLVFLQILQSFNVNAAKFVLMPLAAWIFSKRVALDPNLTDTSKHIIALCLVVPYVLFAPTAGWLSDRFAKTSVIRWTSWMQLAVLGFLIFSLKLKHLDLCITAFFFISLQAALLSPSKIGVVKEYVGARRLGFASGVMEGTVVLAILAGQIAGGAWFDHGLKQHDHGWDAALVPMWTLIGLCLLSIGLAHVTQKSQPNSNRPFSFNEAISHLRDLGEFFKDRSLLLYGLGVAYFWGFGGFINLVILSIAEHMFHGGAGTGGAFAGLWAMPGIGIIGGSVLASFISRRNIELGLAPLGATLMAISSAILAFADPQSILMLVMLVIAGASGAVFLVPLQAMVQEKPSDERRGAVISASNLLNSLAGIVAVALQLVLEAAHVSFAVQFLFITAFSLFMAAITFRHFGADFIRLIGLALIKTIYRVRVAGEDNVPKHGGVLLLPNHVTWADAFFLSAACPRKVRFVMDATFMDNPWVGAFCKVFQTVPIERGNAREALRTAADALKEGDVLCLFPEGQLTRTGTLSELQRGFELIARMAKCPLVPVWTAGAWGSIFSFEGGRFFRKLPHKLPHAVNVAFGPALDAKTTDLEEVRDAMLEASAAAVGIHFQEEGVDTRHGLLWANGYQLGQINALQRRGSYATLAGDPLPDELFALTTAFPEQFDTTCRLEPTFSARFIQHWIGGQVLREAIQHAADASVVFYDFSPEALISVEKPGLVHCPCLALEGTIIAMSMPDPPLAYATSEPQAGRKAGTWGKLLPGFYLRHGDHGAVSVHGPALPEGGLALPAGTTLDAECFLVAPSA